jgi:hypothetical protein
LKKPVSILLFWCEINLVFLLYPISISRATFDPLFVCNITRRVSDKHRSPFNKIRIPLKLVKAGIKLQAVLPQGAQDKINAKCNETGINLDDFKAENFKDILDALTEFSMNVDDKKGEKVRISCGNN